MAQGVTFLTDDQEEAEENDRAPGRQTRGEVACYHGTQNDDKSC